MIKIDAHLEPVPFPRPSSRGRQRFNPPRYSEFKDALGYYAKLAMAGREPLTGAIKLRADFYKRKPKNPTSRNWGDADNHLKAVMDALNGICYLDDRQITDARATKHFGEPHISIELEELK
ncbi:MAG: RusA family crossover junction endodeoxyribonuclease [Selenomonadaceae bacterium]|nr:RusA family crossover junction endodeoxyribonuclease [Selenomonadaceae bacterium]